MMSNRNEMPASLNNFYLKNDEVQLDTLSYALAHSSKTNRRNIIASDEHGLKKLVSAAIEITRFWRGFQCRKSLFSLKENKDILDHYQSFENNTENNDHGVNHNPCVISRQTAAIRIQRAWRKHIDTQVFRYYRDLINFRGRGNPSLMLRCINPNEAKLLDAAAGAHVRFRLAGEKFPPNIYYKIYTHRPVVDMCANSPKDYTAMPAKLKSGHDIHNKISSANVCDNRDGWYQRYENNGWRLVSDRLIHTSTDPVTWETAKRAVDFHHVRLQRKADVEEKRRRRKIEWMKKMYKEGMLKAREADDETMHLVEQAARGLINTVDAQGSEAVMDWEVDELLQWTTSLNFDSYLEIWKESATTSASELDVSARRNSDRNQSSGMPPVAGARPTRLDPFALTGDSSIGVNRLNHSGGPAPSFSTLHEDSCVNEKGESPTSSEDWHGARRALAQMT